MDKKGKPRVGRSILVGILIGAFVLTYIVSNVSAISSWIEGIVSILSPVLIGATIAYLCNPILRFLERRPLAKIRSFSLRRILSITLTFIFLLILIAAIGLLVIPQLMDSVGELIAQYDNYIANAVTYVNRILNSIIDRFPSDGMTPHRDIISIEKVQAALQTLITGTDAIIDVVVGYFRSYATKLVSALSDIILALFISFYLLASKEKRLAQVKKLVAALFNEKHTRFIYDTASLADKTFGKYLEGKIMDSFLVGIICYIAFSIFRLPYAAMTATFIGVANIIPFFGPIIGAVPSGFIIFIAEPSKLLLFIILTLVIMQIDGNVIEPKVLGNSTGVSSLCIIVAISVMGNLWGVFGMVIGVPFAAVVVALAQQYINLRLKDKGLPDDLDEYYDDGDEDDTPKKPHTAFAFYLLTIRYYFYRFLRLFKRKLTLPKKPARADYTVYPPSAETVSAVAQDGVEAPGESADEAVSEIVPAPAATKSESDEAE